MIGAVVAIAADALGEAIAYAGAHPDIAFGLIRTVKAALTDAHGADAMPEEQKRGRLTAIASGLAAARADAVQAAARRAEGKATKTG